MTDLELAAGDCRDAHNRVSGTTDMRLYHFTCAEHLPAILRDGLSIGEVPLSLAPGKTRCKNAVWFTTSPDPSGHGLEAEGREATRQEKIIMGWNPKKPVWWPNKQAIRITVDLPGDDPRLKRWSIWSQRRISTSVREGLMRAGGGKAATWYLYFGTVMPSAFVDVLDLRPAPVREAA